MRPCGLSDRPCRTGVRSSIYTTSGAQFQRRERHCPRPGWSGARGLPPPVLGSVYCHFLPFLPSQQHIIANPSPLQIYFKKAFTFKRFGGIHVMSRAERGQGETIMTTFTINETNEIVAF